MKILVFGASGQVGQALKRCIDPSVSVRFVNRTDVDFTAFKKIESVIHDFQPTHIINAAAYTAVDQAESDSSMARVVNAEAVGIVAACAAKCDATLIHYSTDYVFDGTQTTPYKEDDQPNPVTVYGQSKLLGEKFIRESNCRFFILRTSWIISSSGNNFVKTILRLAQTNEQLKVVNDQVGAPTTANLIARWTVDLVQSDPITICRNETYHLCASGEVSWFDVAVHAISYAQRLGISFRCPPDRVKAISTAEYQTQAKRPLNSRLNTSKLTHMMGKSIPAWEQGVDGTIDQLLKEGFLT